jgi:hypothetical protein
LKFDHNGSEVVLDSKGPSGDYAGWTYGGQRMGFDGKPLSQTSNTNNDTVDTSVSGYVNVNGGFAAGGIGFFGGGVHDLKYKQTLPIYGVTFTSTKGPLYNVTYSPGSVTPGLNFSLAGSWGYGRSKVRFRGAGGNFGSGFPLGITPEFGVSNPGLAFSIFCVGPCLPIDNRYLHENSSISKEQINRIRKERGLPDIKTCSNNDGRSCQ